MNLIKFLKTYQADLILALAVILISITAFNMGKISVLNKQKAQITITEPPNNKRPFDAGDDSTLNAKRSTLNASSVIASKNSTSKLYHFPWCASGYKISEKNKITFATEAAAISAGYILAGNCQR